MASVENLLTTLNAALSLRSPAGASAALRVEEVRSEPSRSRLGV